MPIIKDQALVELEKVQCELSKLLVNYAEPTYNILMSTAETVIYHGPERKIIGRQSALRFDREDGDRFVQVTFMDIANISYPDQCFMLWLLDRKQIEEDGLGECPTGAWHIDEINENYQMTLFHAQTTAEVIFNYIGCGVRNDDLWPWRNRIKPRTTTG